MTENPKPEGEDQGQEPYESADSGALETASQEADFVPEFMNLTSKEDVPDDADAESSPDKEKQAEETDEQRTEGAEESAASETPDADDPTGKRYADQQSRAMKAENRVKELEKQAKENEQVQPIIQFMQNDPALKQAFNQRLRGEAISIDAPLTVPDKPLEPTRPANYNKDDAINEPESDSAKFDLAIQNYPGEVERWRENDDQIKTKKANEQALVLRQEKVMTDFNTSLKDLGVAEEEMSSVIAFSQSEENNTIPNLAAAILSLYRKDHPKKEEPTGDQQTDQAAEIAKTAASRIPKPKPKIVDETEANEEVEGVAVHEWQNTFESRMLESSRT